MLSLEISQEVDIVLECAVTVSYRPSPFIAPVPLGAGSDVGNMLGWSLVEKTVRSGVRVVPGCPERGECIFFPCCSGSLGQERIVPYSYGQGTGVGPRTGERCWPLNLFRGWKSRVGWHSDDDPLFGERGDAKLTVSVSFGARALFQWKGKSCPDGEASTCCLGHGDILDMDGQCQDEILHCTDHGLE